LTASITMQKPRRWCRQTSKHDKIPAKRAMLFT
jgi:hypothetical protein